MDPLTTAGVQAPSPGFHDRPPHGALWVKSSRFQAGMGWLKHCDFWFNNPQGPLGGALALANGWSGEWALNVGGWVKFHPRSLE